MKTSIDHTFNGIVKNSRLQIANRQKFLDLVATYDGKQVELTLKPKRKRRTHPQNNYYWVCVEIMSEDLGYTVSEMHDALKIKFLYQSDRPLPTIKSTATLNTVEFGQYLDQVIKLAAELGIILPDPETIK